MPATTVKSTYSLDEETARTLERLARRLRVSKSEVLRRAVLHMARLDLPPSGFELSALDELQRRLRVTTRDAKRWESQVRRERLATRR